MQVYGRSQQTALKEKHNSASTLTKGAEVKTYVPQAHV